MRDTEKCFHHNFTYFFRIAYNILGNVPDTEDVLQEIYLKLLERKPNTRVAKNYIARMIYNRSIDVVKQHKNTIPLDSVIEPKANVENFNDSLVLERCLTLLEPNERLSLDLFYREDLSIKEIAEITGDSPGAVKVRLHRARKKLKNIFYKNSSEEK